MPSRPYSVLLASRIASSSVSKVMIGATGPKISPDRGGPANHRIA